MSRVWKSFVVKKQLTTECSHLEPVIAQLPKFTSNLMPRLRYVKF